MNGALCPESKADPEFHVRGATKIYKHACWQAIGGLVKEKGWDTVDEVKANMLGWTTRTFSEIQIVHHPLAGAYGTWADWVKNDRASYFAGYHPLFMAMKCISRTFKKPFGIAGLVYASGSGADTLNACPRSKDPQLIQYLRREQMKRLLLKSSLWG